MVKLVTCACLHIVYILIGPPRDKITVNVSSDTITACSFVLQWNGLSSDPVWYAVTILTEVGALIITDNTTLTNYAVTGLNSSTVYNVSVTANNICGSSNTANMLVTTKRNGMYVCL